MFNLFPKFGSPGDCASTDDFIGKPATNWFYTSTPTFTVNDKTYKADELSQFIGEILTENQKLKNELEGWKIGNKNWRKLYDEKADTVDELKNEIERLKKFENWHQPELCNEKIYKLEEENTEYKKGNRNWMNLYQEVVDKNNELLKEVNGLRHLKKENVELMERVNEIDSDVNRDLQDQLFTLKNDYAVLKNRNTELLEKYNGFVTMGGLKYMEAKLQIVQNNYKKCSQERDEFKHQLNAANKENEELKKRIDGLSLAIDRKNFEVDECKTSFENMRKAYEQEAKSANKELEKRLELEKEYEVRLKELNNGLVDVTRENKKFCKIIEDQKAEIEKLKKDIVDYVFEKDEQKHPMYPIHWGGYDPEKWSTTKVALDDAVQAKQREVYGIEEKKTFKPWVEEPIDWKKETTTENLEERVAKLEEQLKYTQKIICPK